MKQGLKLSFWNIQILMTMNKNFKRQFQFLSFVTSNVRYVIDLSSC